MAQGFYSRLADLVTRRRAVVLASYAALTLALGWAGSRITMRADITDLLPRKTASASDFRYYLERFGSADYLYLKLTAPRDAASGDLEEAAGRLEEALQGTALFDSIRFGISEDEALGLLRATMAHLPVLVPETAQDDLAGRVTPEGVRAALERLKADAEGPLLFGSRETMAAEDPLGLLGLIPVHSTGPVAPFDPLTGLFLSEDGRSLLVVARPTSPPQEIDFSRHLLDVVDATLERTLDDGGGIVAEVAGGHLFAVQDAARIRHDIAVTASIALVAITVLFALVLRRIALLVILMIPLLSSTLWTLGIASIYPGHLNVVTVAFAAILLGLGDDSLTHLYLRFREEAAAGAASSEAIRAALGSTGPSILIATLTSGLAFAVLTFVEFRGLSELGAIAAIGMINLLVAVFFLFPALLPLTLRSGPAEDRLALPVGPLVAFHRFGSRHRGAVLGTAATLALLAAAACSNLRFSADLKALRGRDIAQERLESVLGSFGSAADSIHLIDERGDLDASLRAAERWIPVCDALAEAGMVTGCSAPAARIPSAATQRERFERAGLIDWAGVAARLRREADELGMRAGFFEPFIRDLEGYGSWEAVRLDPGEMAPPFGIEGTAIVTSLHLAPGIDAASVLARARSIDPGAFDHPPRIASVGLVTADLTRIIESDFRLASLLAVAAVGLIIIAAFRRPARLLLVATPVIGGCLVMLGGLALLGVPINLMNLVATPLVLGLGIDFGVYIVNRHLEEGSSDVPRVLRHTGGAILLTGLTTMAGFGSLLAADFAGLRSLGWVAVLGIGGSLATALLVLPLLLPSVRKPRGPLS